MSRVQNQSLQFPGPLALMLVAGLPAFLYVIYAVSLFFRNGYPVPDIQDEFSYLLAADTFAHFRLANPTPPMWEAFESLHINVVPTYVSMYPPGQGLFLAFGQVVFGHPWWGVVASGACFVFATGWALLAWLPRWWALGTTLTAMSFVVGTYWTFSYWGGSVAATGGALVLASVGYMRKEARPSLAALWALGCAVAVCSRPYEGGFLIALSALELFRLWRSGQHRIPAVLLRGALPVATAAALFLSAYCFATTGNPVRMPYQENAKRYQIRRTFHWQKDRPAPQYNHQQMRKMYVWLLREHMDYREKYGQSAARFAFTYGGIAILCIGGFWALLGWRSGGYRWVLITCSVGLAAVLMIVYIHPHYFAPYTSFVAAAYGLGAWHAAGKHPRRILGIPAVAAVCLSLLSIRLWVVSNVKYHPAGWSVARAAIQLNLERGGQSHLILVKYSEERNPHQEWVYNSADFRQSKVLWARWWTPEKNGELARLYCDRNIWVLEPDRPNAGLIPYEAY